MRSFSFVFVGMMAMAVGFGNCRCRGQETAIAAPAARPTLEAIGRHDASRTVECAKASIRVVDGDTIEVEINGKTESVRYIGIDTPETVDPRKPVQCFGVEASKKNKELV